MGTEYDLGSYNAAPSTEVGLKNGTTVVYAAAVDNAGNWPSLTIVFVDSMNENRALLSTSGPYGPWFLIAIIVDVGILAGAYELHHRSKPPPPEEKRPLDKETVVDGYPKYLRKIWCWRLAQGMA